MTKDEDFSRQAIQPDAAIQVVWVRVGNCRKAVLLAKLESLLPSIEAALEAGDRLVEIR